MKKFTPITFLVLLSASLGVGLFADGKGLLFGNKGLFSGNKADSPLKKTDGYLQHSLPSALSFGVDAFPTDRLMLVTKAPKIPDLTPIITTPVIDANQSAVIFPPPAHGNH